MARMVYPTRTAGDGVIHRLVFDGKQCHVRVTARPIQGVAVRRERLDRIRHLRTVKDPVQRVGHETVVKLAGRGFFHIRVTCGQYVPDRRTGASRHAQPPTPIIHNGIGGLLLPFYVNIHIVTHPREISRGGFIPAVSTDIVRDTFAHGGVGGNAPRRRRRVFRLPVRPRVYHVVPGQAEIVAGCDLHRVELTDERVGFHPRGRGAFHRVHDTFT